MLSLLKLRSDVQSSGDEDGLCGGRVGVIMDLEKTPPSTETDLGSVNSMNKKTFRKWDIYVRMY